MLLAALGFVICTLKMCRIPIKMHDDFPPETCYHKAIKDRNVEVTYENMVEGSPETTLTGISIQMWIFRPMNIIMRSIP